MKLPWVSRTEYDHLNDAAQMAYKMATQAEQRSAYYSERLARADANYDALLEKFTALRLAGAVEPTPVIVAPPAPERDGLKELIAEMANGDVRLHRLMMKQLRLDRAAGMDDDSIMRRIVAGQSIDEGIPA